MHQHFQPGKYPEIINTTCTCIKIMENHLPPSKPSFLANTSNRASTSALSMQQREPGTLVYNAQDHHMSQHHQKRMVHFFKSSKLVSKGKSIKFPMKVRMHSFQQRDFDRVCSLVLVDITANSPNSGCGGRSKPYSSDDSSFYC
jgi:hypothetical protein